MEAFYKGFAVGAPDSGLKSCGKRKNLTKRKKGGREAALP
jgi:hypothetical protein